MFFLVLEQLLRPRFSIQKNTCLGYVSFSEFCYEHKQNITYPASRNIKTLFRRQLTPFLSDSLSGSVPLKGLFGKEFESSQKGLWNFTFRNLPYWRYFKTWKRTQSTWHKRRYSPRDLSLHTKDYEMIHWGTCHAEGVLKHEKNLDYLT